MKIEVGSSRRETVIIDFVLMTLSETSKSRIDMSNTQNTLQKMKDKIGGIELLLKVNNYRMSYIFMSISCI